MTPVLEIRRPVVRLLLAVALAALAAAPLPTAAGASEGRTLGIDVSRFQGEIDWPRVGESEVGFAFIQASRGSGADCTVVADRCGPDELFKRNYRQAKAAGIRVGAYHRAFVQGRGVKAIRRDARREARVFNRSVGAVRNRDLLPVLDFETPFGEAGERPLRVWVRTWLDRVGRRHGVPPMIYTNHSSWQRTGDTPRFARRGHRLWVANWNVDEPLVPARNWGGHGWAIWQFTSAGRVPGISGNVDQNWLNGGYGKISVRGARRSRG